MNANIIRIFFLALGSIFALLLLIAGIGGYLITGPAPTYAGAAVEVSDEAAASLDRKIQDIAEASEGDVVSILITEREATSKLDELAKAGELPVEMNYIQIHFDDGTIYGCAIVKLLIDVQVALQAKIGVDEEGKLDITIESLNFGRLTIPRTLIDQVMNALMKQTEERLEGLHVELQDIAIENGEMIITAQVKQSSSEAWAIGLCPAPSASLASEFGGTGLRVD